MKTKKNKRASKKTKKGGLFFDPFRKDMTIYVSIDGGFTRKVRLSKNANVNILMKELNIWIPSTRKIIKIIDPMNDTIFENGTIHFIGNLKEFKNKTFHVITQDRSMDIIKPVIKHSRSFLEMKCKNSGDCLVFGKYIHELNAYFNNFSDFSLVSGNIKPIGKLSANGFIREIKYEKNGYTSYAILKSSIGKIADNLGYEYIVGKYFINTIIHKFPCFLYTYGLYYYTSDQDYQKIKSAIEYNAKNLANDIQLSTINYNQMCLQSKYACLLIQHLHRSISLNDMLKIDEFVTSDMIYVLFIIYQSLYALKDKFTHYDLHPYNVLLFTCQPSKCIEYVYHLKDETFTFRSIYVPKIIDYGRCYFNNNTFSSKDIKNKLCQAKSCNFNPDPNLEPVHEKINCGYNYGFIELYFDSNKYNDSVDLMLLDRIENMLQYKYEGMPIYQLLTKFVNITDAYEKIKNFCKQQTTLYNDYEVEQTIHVYENGNDMN